MFTLFTKSAVCIYSMPGLLTLLSLLFITKKTVMEKIRQSLLSFKWDQLHNNINIIFANQRFIHFTIHNRPGHWYQTDMHSLLFT